MYNNDGTSHEGKFLHVYGETLWYIKPHYITIFNVYIPRGTFHEIMCLPFTLSNY